jgi:hypothetical protein
MSFVLPLRPSKSTRPIRPSKQLQPPTSPRRRPSLATRRGVLKRRKSSVTSFNAPSLRFFEGMFGDEFPEVFSRSDHRGGKTCASILSLPTEILQMTCACLSKSDLKRLRLASSELAARVELRIDRAFISPNRANLRCLDAILSHPRYRLHVEELIWDDAQLEAFPSLEDFSHAIWQQEAVARQKIHAYLEDFLSEERYNENNNSQDLGSQMLAPQDLFLHDGHLTNHAKTLLLRLGNQAARDIITQDDKVMMSVEESYSLYQKLYQDEQEIMKRGMDVKALHRALAEFPDLKRITLTTEVWRPGYSLPSYDTPFFRALPPGFRKPAVSPWLARRYDDDGERDAHRQQTLGQPVESRLPFEWRSYSIMMSSLVAVPHPGIEAVVLDTEYDEAGVSHQLFAMPNQEYDATIEACQILDLKTFKLAINSHGTSESCAPFLHSGLIKNLFSSMRYLEHLDFRPNTLAHSTFFPQYSYDGIFVSENLFSDATLHRLKHFALRCTTTTEDDLFRLITKLKHAESITLDRLRFRVGNYNSLLDRLRESFAATACRPQITILTSCFRSRSYDGQRLYLYSQEVDGYLYNNGICPFSADKYSLTENQTGWLIDDWDPTQRKNYDHNYARRLRRSGNESPLLFPYITDYRFADVP